ncbi:MAG TPA: class II fructose-bisphosphate aldolase [Agriterribacter sp.]|nr:class II fructose-bisphosphate aldolase [Chitinophagaceae bacterium]HRP30410.1 class II fructose-bisphosphate aldolase [Agriterribacter sp.]
MKNDLTLQQKLKACQLSQQALLATNFYNFETLKGILLAAKAEQSPLILQLTRGSIEYLGLQVAKDMASAMLSSLNVEGWIHLDHGDSYELAAICLDAGFDSVMIDASEKPFAENVEITKRVVKLAESYGANVEAELGYVAKLGQQTGNIGFTEPDEAKRFVEETGVDALAVAIGSAHGFYKETPNLDFERLSAIHNATGIALVLHGASGIPHDQLREAIKRGICKINLATETKNIFMKTLKNILLDAEEIDLRKTFPPATNAVTQLVRDKLHAIQFDSVAEKLKQ